MPKVRTRDLFITHAWRYHDDWNRLVDLLDRHDSRGWRNFSLPWYDPALRPGSEFGGQKLRENLETQVLPAHAVILLSSVYAQEGARKWLDLELEVARRVKIPVIGLPAWGEKTVPPDIDRLSDETTAWNGAAIFSAVDRLGGAPGSD